MKRNRVYIAKIVILLIFIWIVSLSNFVYAEENNTLTNTTRVYFLAEITKGYANGDCILLENYDSQGNKIYGMIDAGRKIAKEDKDGNASTSVKEFLKDHGVEKLEFLAITHQHADHNGDALTVLDNFEIKTIYMKEFDKKWSPSGRQDIYEDIIERAVAKNIKVVGVSHLSLTSSDISPSRSTDFINNTKNAKEELFESFNETNIKFEFGSSKVEIFNWEMFDENGQQYITGKTTNTTKEMVNDDNNNSIAILLTQGEKKAFFAGDMNNNDKNEQTGRIGDEDRIKNLVGKIDLLKLGHHGYQGSNTEDYMNVLKPEYAVITNDVDKAYANTIAWLKNNNVNYLYTTSDPYEICATITDSKVYLGTEVPQEKKDEENKDPKQEESSSTDNSDYASTSDSKEEKAATTTTTTRNAESDKTLISTILPKTGVGKIGIGITILVTVAVACFTRYKSIKVK